MNCVFRGQHITEPQCGLHARTWLSAVAVDLYIGATKSAAEGDVYTRSQGTGFRVAKITTHKFIRVEVS